MPLVNIYFQNSEHLNQLKEITTDLKEYLVGKLTCGDIKLSPSEISIRFLKVTGGEMIANIELEIIAHAFQERIKKQDEICFDVMNHIKEKTGIEDVKVWLILSELGHSW